MIIETEKLEGAALDWAVEVAEEMTVSQREFQPSTNWEQGGPIIEREGIELFRNKERDRWYGTQYGGPKSYGPTPLIAAMRRYVASKLGDEIDVPEELV